MQKTINDYPQPTGTKEEVLAWWNEYTRNLSINEVVNKIEYSSWSENKLSPYKGYVATEVDSTGGYEDAGSYMDKTFMIHKVTNPKDVLGYIAVVGRYSSWDASEWDEVLVVKPVEVTQVEFQ